MCRLYGMRATHPTKIGCDLVESQNSLIRQSREDSRGLTNPDGWGIGLVTESEIHCTRDVDPAYEDLEDYRRAIHAERPLAAIAHVRLATIGEAAFENTHPFRWRDSLLAHNGHIPDFDAVRAELLAALDDEHRAAIGGDTDSEHFFHLLLQRRVERRDDSMVETLRACATRVAEWIDRVGGDEDRPFGLNVLWTIGPELAGSRLRASLFALEREEPHECPICGERHADPPNTEPYRQVVVASERLTDEEWTEVPESSVFRVGPDLRFESGPLLG